MENLNSYCYKEVGMFFLEDDYKKLRVLENQAYSIHKDYIARNGKSLDEVIRSSKAYTDFLSSFKIRHLKTGDNMSIDTKNKITNINNGFTYLSPTEKFALRNNINKKKSDGKELRNLRLFTAGLILFLIGGGTLLHKYSNKESQSSRYYQLIN